MSKITSFNGIDIVVRTRDEHCEPHAHVFHTGQRWELRIFFSYVGDQIVDIELLHGKLPKQTVVQAAMDAIIDHLDKVRECFWNAIRNVCLDNKHIVVVKGVAYAATEETEGAVLVKTARYIPSSQSIEYKCGGGLTSLTAKCP